jgi:hypothetical protein
MRTRRRRLALALLDGLAVKAIPAALIEDVVNFFEDVATAWSEKYMSLKAVYSMFYDDAVHYWFVLWKAYALQCRKDLNSSQEYREYELMLADLQDMDAKGRAPQLSRIPETAESFWKSRRLWTSPL